MFTDGLIDPPADFVGVGPHPPALIVQASAGQTFNVRLDRAHLVRDPARQEALAVVVAGSASEKVGGVLRVRRMRRGDEGRAER